LAHIVVGPFGTDGRKQMRLREVERGDRLVWRFLIWFISLVLVCQ
jgi:hypothetical protein